MFIKNIMNKLGLYTKNQLEEQIITMQDEIRILRGENSIYKSNAKADDKYIANLKRHNASLIKEKNDLLRVISFRDKELKRFQNRARLADKDKRKLRNLVQHLQREKVELEDKILSLEPKANLSTLAMSMYDALNTKYERLAFLLAMPYAMHHKLLIRAERSYLEAVGYSNEETSKH